MDDLPAILGGSPAFSMGPPDWPGPDPAVREGLLTAWADGSWGRYDGGLVDRLETTLANWVNRRHALAVGSGTLGLELALKAVGAGKGEGIVLCDYDYPGNFLTVHALGAMPILVDVEAETGQMSADSLERSLVAKGIPPIRAVVLSPIHGNLPDYSRIESICLAHGIPLIEDACQVPGSTCGNRRSGSFGAISIWSFGGSKLLSAGRGGMVFSDDPTLFQRMKMANSRGSIVGPMSELQAAVLLAQWPNFQDRHAGRAMGAERLRRLFAGINGPILPKRNEPPECQAFYKWDFFWDSDRSGLNRDQIVAALKSEGIAAEVGFRSLHAGRSRSRYLAVEPLVNSKAITPGRIVIHHPVLLEANGPEKIATGLKRILAHAKEIAQLGSEQSKE